MSDRRQWYFEPLTPDKNSLYTLHHSQAQIRLIVAQSMSCPVSFPRHSSFHSVAESEPCLYTWWKCQHISGSSVTAVRCRRGEILSRYIKTTCKNGPKTEQHYSFASSSLSAVIWLLFWDSVLTNPQRSPCLCKPIMCELLPTHAAAWGCPGVSQHHFAC